jgi:hypothetical protein
MGYKNQKLAAKDNFKIISDVLSWLWFGGHFSFLCSPIIFAYRRKSFAPAAENSPLEEGSQVKPDEEAWLDDMETESA